MILFVLFIPVIGCPLGVFSPPKVNICEWSAVTTIKVSEGDIAKASETASSNASISSKALLPLLWWWAWSIRPAKLATNKMNTFF